MDLSSLTEPQQQQMQQLQTQYQQHQQQRQAEAASASASAVQQQQYYQSQPHSYDQSHYSYYHNQNHQQSQQYASYYNNPDYANAYQMQQQQYSQAETVQPPEAQVIEQQQQQQQQQNAYYTNTGSGSGTQVGQGGDQLNSGYNVPNGINNAAAAAAVAALSQLTQFAAERGSQERQWYGNGGGYGPPMGPVQFMGPLHHGPPAGRSPYRGGGRRGGSPFRGGRGNFAGGSGPPFRGRGRGRGRGGWPHTPHGASSSLPEGSSAEGTGGDVGNQQPIRIAWCELCRVDCTSLEILEQQHKNGKRHKKNLERLEEMKSSTTEAQNDEKISTDTPDSVQQGEEEKPENEVGSDQNQGLKRKMRGGGRGGKRVKTFGGTSKRSVGPTKPKPMILICDLCNVKCDTQEVFDRHVSGKKHNSKVKLFEGHKAMYGPTGVQALYPPNPMAQALSRPQQAIHGPPPPPQEAYIPSQVQNPNPQLSDAPLEFSNQNNVAQPSASVEPQTKLITSG